MVKATRVGRGPVLPVLSVVIGLTFAVAACGDESTDLDPNRSVFKVNRCGKGCE